MLKTRNIGQKRQPKAPGFNKNYEYQNWIASHGDVTGDLSGGSFQSYRRVAFDDQNKTLETHVKLPYQQLVPLRKPSIVSGEWT